MPLIKLFIRTGALVLPFSIIRDVHHAQEASKPKE